MTQEQRELWGGRKLMDFPHVTPPSSPEARLTPPPPVSPRRSTRPSVANPRYFGMEIHSPRPRGRGSGRSRSRGRGRGRGQRGGFVTPRAFMDGSSDEDDIDRIQENQDGLQLPDIETTPPSPVTRPPVTRPLGTSSSQSSPPSYSRSTSSPENRQLGTSSQSSSALGTPNTTTGDRDSSPGHDGELETLDDTPLHRPHFAHPASFPPTLSTPSTFQTEAGSGSKQYFKGGSTIPGSGQKTHDMALLESVLAYMVDHQRRLGTINMTQIARDTRATHPLSFGSRPISEISKLAKTRISKSVSSYKLKESGASLSGRTRTELSPIESLVSQILALDTSLRLNLGSGTRNVSGTTSRNTDEEPRILTPVERQEVVGELNLESPVIVNRRRRAGQEAGRELRESSLAASIRRPRSGHPRLETSLTNLVETANNNSRSAAGELNSMYAESMEERQMFRERRMEMEFRQRELDRETKERELEQARLLKETAREAKEKENEKDRQLARENGILFASAIARLVPGSGTSGSNEKTLKKNLNFQYVPEEGSEPFPLLVSLTSLPSLLSELKSYTNSLDVVGIVWEGSVLTDLEQFQVTSNKVKVIIVKKGGKSYLKLFE